MSAFPDWQQYAVKQKRNETGCIPTGYEMILRAAGFKNVNFETFQDEFDLDKDLRPGEKSRNNFKPVAAAIQSKYPNIHFKHVEFLKNEGQKKLAAVEDLISKRLPFLISLARAPLNPPFGGPGYHIMPVVDATPDTLTLLWCMDENNRPITVRLAKKDFVAIHEAFDGGNDIAYLNS